AGPAGLLELIDSIAAWSPNASVHAPCGMTAGLLLTDIDRAGVAEAAATGGLGVCVGRPIDGVELALAPIDANGDSADELVQGPRAQGRLGEFVVSAAHIKYGYDNMWRTTADSDRDSLKGQLWLRTNYIIHI